MVMTFISIVSGLAIALLVYMHADDTGSYKRAVSTGYFAAFLPFQIFFLIGVISPSFRTMELGHYFAYVPLIAILTVPFTIVPMIITHIICAIKFRGKPQQKSSGRLEKLWWISVLLFFVGSPVSFVIGRGIVFFVGLVSFIGFSVARIIYASYKFFRVAVLEDEYSLFIDIKNQIDSSEIRKILALCVFDNSAEGLDKVKSDYNRHYGWLLYGWCENEKIIGICGFKTHFDCVEIMHIAVCEENRGKNIDTLMISALKNRYNMNIEAETDDDAVDFYRKCNFETFAIQKYNMRRWSCVLNKTGR